MSRCSRCTSRFDYCGGPHLPCRYDKTPKPKTVEQRIEEARRRTKAAIDREAYKKNLKDRQEWSKK